MGEVGRGRGRGMERKGEAGRGVREGERRRETVTDVQVSPTGHRRRDFCSGHLTLWVCVKSQHLAS